MTFDEWLDAYYSGTQIDDVIAGMMRVAFEAGQCEVGAVGLRDKFAIAAIAGCTASGKRAEWLAKHAYAVADAMLKEREKSVECFMKEDDSHA